MSACETGIAERGAFLIGVEDRILVTGAAGFIGARVIASLLERGYRNLGCFVRPSSDTTELEAILEHHAERSRPEIIRGNLLSRQDCETACKDVAVILHLAAGTGEKSFPDAFMNSVVATRNLLDASLHCGHLRRFVLVSSFAVYTNQQRSTQLDESCPTEEHPELRDAYCYAKMKQEQIVAEYGKNFGIPHVILRPGSVFGPGSSGITGRVGLGTFGIFLHLGGSNTIPYTYVDNCADAIGLAGLVKGVDGEVFNVVDDDLPSSRRFLHQYKKNVRQFRSLYVPRLVSYGLCCLWEKYVNWSKGQLPLAFSERRWYSEWRHTRYSNAKLKRQLGWTPKVPMDEGMRRYFTGLAQKEPHA